MKIHFITGNPHKLKEVQTYFDDSGFSIAAADFQFREIQTSDQHQIVFDKARQAFQVIREPLIVDDTAIFFDGFRNFPGTFTSELVKSIGIGNILKLIEDNHPAYFKTLIVYKDENTEEAFEGIINGKISMSITANNQLAPFGDIFIPDGYAEPLNRLISNNNVSHRYLATQKLINHLKERVNERV